MNTKITFLTVGEYSTVDSLHASQVLPFVSYLNKRNIDSQWISFMPIESGVKDFLKNNNKSKKFRSLLDKNNITFISLLYPITISRIHSYIFRDFLLKMAGKKLAQILTEQCLTEKRNIIHCRSYFATATALEARKYIKSIEISFDMRSLLPPEIPMKHPLFGNFLYGGLKKWEHRLLMDSDYSFLQCQRGIKLLELEGIECLPHYIPIFGFDPDIEKSYNNNNNFLKIGYVGSLSCWQSAKILEAVFDALSKAIPNCQFCVITLNNIHFSLNNVEILSANNDEVRKILSQMTAVVVPGPEHVDDYYSSLKVSSNFFTTKAAEALSMSIPLIVNKNARELADYIKINGCGIEFIFKNDGVFFDNEINEKLPDKNFWEELKMKAEKCSSSFSRISTFTKYLETWNVH